MSQPSTKTSNNKKCETDASEDPAGVAKRAGHPPAPANRDNEDDAKAAAGAKKKADILKALRATKLYGSYWEELPSEYKSDRAIALVALTHKKAALGTLPVELRQDREFLTEAVTQKPTLWEELPKELQSDMTFVRNVAAYLDGYPLKKALNAASRINREGELPAALLNDRILLGCAVSKIWGFWARLPDEIKKDVNFVRSLPEFTDKGMLKEILSECLGSLESEKSPEPEFERAIWIKVFESPTIRADFPLCNELLANYEPNQAMVAASDRDFLVKLCGFHFRKGSCFVDESLRNDVRFLRDVLTFEPKALKDIPPHLLLAFPELVVDFLDNAVPHFVLEDFMYAAPEVKEQLQIKRAQKRRRKECDYLAKNIASGLWHNPAVVRAWLRGGGRFLERRFPESSKSDQEVFLLLAKHYYPKRDFEGLTKSFSFASPALRKDKKFILKAILLDPSVFHAVHEDLRGDYDIFVAAFGGTLGEFPHISMETFQGCIATFRPRIEEELQMHEVFCKTILTGISKQGENPSVLALLNQGEETALKHKRRIAAYLDVPIGERLNMLRQAKRNLDFVLP